MIDVNLIDENEQINIKVRAGNIANCKRAWRELTSDRWLLKCVNGMEIQFLVWPVQNRVPHPFRLSKEEIEFVDNELTGLLEKQVIKLVEPVRGQWISNIFLRPKQNGKFRMILDLTELNKLIKYEHFKMFNLRTALDLIKPGDWMASADLTDAYYSVPINEKHKKFLRFFWKGKILEYQALPNGLSPGPRVFTKLLKPLYSSMAEKGHTSFPYIDDSFVLGETKNECREAVKDLVQGFEDLGFTINRQKSVLQPTQRLTFLGFEIDSVEMNVSLTEEKKGKIQLVAGQILGQELPIIREVAGLVGLLVAYTPAVEYAGAHFKALERDKIRALKRAKGNFNDYMWISVKGKEDILWWLENLDNPREIRREDPTVELFTDASMEGWGAHTGHDQTGGRWHHQEIEHINVLELKAILFGLKSLCRGKKTHIRIRTDSTTALAYVKNMGGTKSEACAEVATEIWDWAQTNECWLSITHIPGVENVLADLRSRKFKDQLEWSLNPGIFEDICSKWGRPEIDLFASRLNAKVTKYVSWEPEPDNWRTDAFSFSWTNKYIYCFPPFSLLPRVVRKVQRDQARAIIMAPHWTTQPWFPLLQRGAKKTLTYPAQEGNLTGQGRSALNTGELSLEAIKLTAYLF